MLNCWKRLRPEQIADCVVARESIQPQQGVQSAIPAQPVGVREAFGACQHGDQERGERRSGIDRIGGPPPHRHVLPDFACQVNLPQISDEDRHPAKGRDGPRRLSPDQPPGRVQRLNLSPD
jgi:hypothetical protein